MTASKFACPDSIKLGQGYRAALFAITENGKLLRIHIILARIKVAEKLTWEGMSASRTRWKSLGAKR
jgi:hypothetical protein